MEKTLISVPQSVEELDLLRAQIFKNDLKDTPHNWHSVLALIIQSPSDVDQIELAKIERTIRKAQANELCYHEMKALAAKERAKEQATLGEGSPASDKDASPEPHLHVVEQN